MKLALRHFIGRRTVTQAYCDNAGEFIRACRDLGIVAEFSQPGVPQTNSKIERTNQDVLAMTRTALVAVGMPPPFWPYASRCVTFNDNVRYTSGISAWSLTHVHDCTANLLPFGVGVWYLPTPKRNTPSNYDGRARWGVFAGYVITSG